MIKEEQNPVGPVLTAAESRRRVLHNMCSSLLYNLSVILFGLLLSVLQVGSPCHNHLPETHEVKSLCVPLTILSYSNFLTLSSAFPPILQLP